MNKTLFRRSLALAAALWAATLVPTALALVFERALHEALGTIGTAVALSALNFTTTALVALLFAWRAPVVAWRCLLWAMLMAQATAWGLCLLLRVDLAASQITLLVDLVLWVAAAVAGTAYGRRLAQPR